MDLEALENQSEPFRLALRDGPEDNIEMGEWCEAAPTAVQLMQKHWRSDRADRLATHHAIVMDLASQYGWLSARRYDISVRRLYWTPDAVSSLETWHN